MKFFICIQITPNTNKINHPIFYTFIKKFIKIANVSIDRNTFIVYNRSMNNENIKEICQIISELNNKEEVEQFLNELLTQSELSDIEQRWNILKKLTDNESQRKISKNLSVSLCKITRGSKILKDEKSMIKKILSKGVLLEERWRS